jgi:hypothetical protein
MRTKCSYCQLERTKLARATQKIFACRHNIWRALTEQKTAQVARAWLLFLPLFYSCIIPLYFPCSARP